MRLRIWASVSRGVPVYSPAFAGSHCADPWRDGQAELTWVAGYIPRWFTRPQTVTHPSTNRARRRVTSLITTNALTTTPRHHLEVLVVISEIQTDLADRVVDTVSARSTQHSRWKAVSLEEIRREDNTVSVNALTQSFISWIKLCLTQNALGLYTIRQTLQTPVSSTEQVSSIKLPGSSWMLTYLGSLMSRLFYPKPSSDYTFWTVLGKILWLKYLKYFTKYPGKEVFKIVF